MATQTRGHAGHSHDHHHHHHDNTYLTSSNKNDAGVKITRVGLYVNLGMAIVKTLGGHYFNSKALLADGLHSLTDLISDIITLATVSWSLKSPTKAWPNAFGKIESLGALGVSGVLLLGGLHLGQDAIVSLCHMFLPGFTEFLESWGFGHSGHSHGHGVSEGDLGPNINAAWLAAGSIAIKEWLYHATMKIAKERRSNVLASNAYHHRVDSLTALVALIMIVGSNFMKSAAWMDPVGGLVISLMVLQAGYGNARDSLFELLDYGVDEDVQGRVQKATEGVLTSLSDKVELRQVQGTKAGQSYLMDLELGVPPTWTVVESQRVERLVRETVGSKVRGLKRLKIRFVSVDSGEPDVADEFITSSASPRESPEPEGDANGHDHGHKH